jgi:hypothetical protein
MEMQRPSQPPVVLPEKGKLLNQRRVVLVSVNLALFIMAAWAFVGFGSIQDCASYYLRGETLFADAREKSFGSAAPGETVAVSYKLLNRGKTPIRILGCHALCNCVMPRDLPFTIKPHESTVFTTSIQMPNARQAGSTNGMHLRLPLTLFTSNPVQPRISLSVEGDVRGKSGDPAGL